MLNRLHKERQEGKLYAFCQGNLFFLFSQPPESRNIGIIHAGNKCCCAHTCQKVFCNTPPDSFYRHSFGRTILVFCYFLCSTRCLCYIILCYPSHGACPLYFFNSDTSLFARFLTAGVARTSSASGKV